ncbi:hypothetical protein [Xenorhabdus kozodoii]|uniref:Transglutaminase-like domain-containing protein n=1 Tax=Xenorhabdus kozodoii TaxID=351676 RepID=A0A2D0L5Q9_9GAMM|nr:hypothetical protein [Xenorhabdus kozodoii]PHM70915.1 hypothetical protein Xkoz_02924 [Xenorhabdus kozodoii]
MTMLLPYNLFLARKAINYVNIQIGVTSTNQMPIQTPEQIDRKHHYEVELFKIRDSVMQRVQEHVGNTRSNSFYRKHMMFSNAATIESHLGNCGEKAILAFSYLKNLGAKPLDLFDIDLENDGHTFVVIGRETGYMMPPNTWNPESVVCDPWTNQAYPIKLYDSKAPFTGNLILHYRYGGSPS